MAGVDGEDSRHRGRNGMGRGTYRQAAWQTDANFHRYGVFTELTLGAGTDQRWISGLRIDRASARDERQSIGGMMGNRPNPSAGQTRKEWLGSGFLRYEQDLADGLTWYAGLGHSERMPDYWELFSPDHGPSGAVNAFTGVQPERTTQLDVGLQFKGPRVQAWVSAYAGQIQDYILFTYHGSGMMGMSQANNVDARIAGAEAGLEVSLAAQWKLGGTLAYAWGENRDQQRPLPQMPPLEARLSANWKASAGAPVRCCAR